MPRIVGVDIPKEKRMEIALGYIYGIGRATSNRILKAAHNYFYGLKLISALSRGSLDPMWIELPNLLCGANPLPMHL